MQRLRFVQLGPLVGLGLFLSGCADPGEVGGDESDQRSIGRARSALGEPVDGYPSHSERVMLYWTNRIRVEPRPFHDKYRGSELHRDPQHPLAYHRGLGRAARWQARHVTSTECPLCGDHSSCCEIGQTDSGYECVSEVTDCGVTGWRSRIELIAGVSPNGENAYAFHEHPGQAITEWAKSDGHWKNMTRGDHTHLGTGDFVPEGHRYHGWIQVFGRFGSERPVVPVGTHFPEMIQEHDPPHAAQPEQTDTRTFGIIYHQPDGGPPERARVAIDGQCRELSLAYGEPNRGAYETRVPLSDECDRYAFYVTDDQGQQHVVPSSGSYGASLAREGCPAYESTPPSNACTSSGSNPGPTADSGSAARHDGGPAESDAPSADNGSAGDAAASSGGSFSGSASESDGAETIEGACSVSHAASGDAIPLAAAWLAVITAVRRRSQRSRARGQR